MPKTAPDFTPRVLVVAALISQATRGEIEALSQLCRDRWTALNTSESLATIQSLTIGDRVAFDGGKRRGWQRGRVISIDGLKARVDVDGLIWTVAGSLLRPLLPLPGGDTHASRGEVAP